MKKIAITAAAALALGVAASTPANNDAGNNATDVNATETETGNDIDNAAADANAVNTTDSELDSIGDAAANTASDVGNAASDAGNAVENAVD